MPYIPTKQEEARQKKWKTEKERKDNILNTSFDKLTMNQQERALRKTRWKLYHAFPNVTQRKEEDNV